MDTYGFEKGDRVLTPQGGGTVVYRRMAPPNYSQVEAYSVCLDAKKAEMRVRLSYIDTIYPAELVKAEV